MHVLVFSTSVNSLDEVKSLKPLIDSLAGKNNWNFALDDRERILRIVSDKLTPLKAIELLQANGYTCHELQ
jgi:hypothetical protein